MIFDKLTNCEIAEIDFALLPKPASKAINQSEFFQIRVNSGIHHTALDSAQLMKMHGKAASGDLINFSKVSITFSAGIENPKAENIFKNISLLFDVVVLMHLGCFCFTLISVLFFLIVH